MAISEQDVYEAADQIRDEGNSPSAIKIREITQTGSLGTIQKFLIKWRHRETVSATTSNPPPEAVLKSIQDFGDNLWRLALQQAEKAASVKVREAREEREQALRDADEAISHLEKGNRVRDDLEQKVEHLSGRLVEEQSKCSEKEASLKSLVLASSDQQKKLEMNGVELQKMAHEKLNLGVNVDMLERQVAEQREVLQQSKAIQVDLQHSVEQKNAESMAFQEKWSRAEAALLESQSSAQGANMMKEKVERQLDEAELMLAEQKDQVEQLKVEMGRLQGLVQQQAVELKATKKINVKLEELLSRLGEDNFKKAREDKA
jgi:chromosome segregation ATPase